MQNIWIATTYAGSSKELLWKYKFERVRSALHPLSALLHTATPFLGNFVVTEVPTVPGHVRQRGYDHAALLAKAYAKRSKLPYASLLARATNTQQRGLGRSQRLQNAAQAFYAKKPGLVAGKKILLVDDIVTTGATIKAATQSLKAAGAIEVCVAAVAWHNLPPT